MQTLRRGLVAGLLAGLVLAMLDFVTDGTPGRLLPEALHWFGITIANPTISRFAGFFLLIVLSGVFGLIFGALQRERVITISRALLSGRALGFAWWLVFSLLLANIMSHHSPLSLDFGRFLSTFPIDLLFGVVLGAIYFQLQQRRRAAALQA
jgi:xanthosine utilization system XapX-like protein